MSIRILFCACPAFGHVYPLIPLAQACRDADHEVAFATGEDFIPRLNAIGFDARPACPSLSWAWQQAANGNPELAVLPSDQQWRFGVWMFSDVVPRSVVPQLLRAIDDIGPDLLIFEATYLAAGAAGTLAGIPAVCHSIGFPAPSAMRDEMRRLVSTIFREHGVTSPPMDPLCGNACIDICPPSLRGPVYSPAPMISMRPVPYGAPDGAAPSWVRQHRDRPLVHVTLGTVYQSTDVLRAAVDGLTSLHVDAIVAVGPDGDPHSLGPVPDAVHVQRFLNNRDVWPHVDAVVHHGGAGTMLGALTYGLPQLALPQGADQFVNADLLVRSGAGMRLLPQEVTASTVAGAMRALLNEPAFRDRAEELAAEVATMPAPHEVVPLLLETARQTVLPWAIH